MRCSNSYSDQKWGMGKRYTEENADQYSLSGLAKKVNDLAKRARNNQLKPARSLPNPLRSGNTSSSSVWI